MALKKFNPTTPGQRQLVMVDRSALYKGKPVKALTEGKHSSGGRNNTGRMVVRFRGGGTSSLIVSSISSVPRSICRRPSSAWNTIRTAPPLLRC
jgi:ribosomal protein L2